MISNSDNYYTQVIATATEWKEAISRTFKIASYRRNDDFLTRLYMSDVGKIHRQFKLLESSLKSC
ncbi:MAG: hypothetical protein QNJ51_13050 [Calothrix sp. MO_167.B12]|nr:hypothetical protein [Calothrix sp. MO_167.B12]